LEAREVLCSTGIPGGVALLHPRHPDPYCLMPRLFSLDGRFNPCLLAPPTDGPPTFSSSSPAPMIECTCMRCSSLLNGSENRTAR
jgi:hypothetical protein